MIMWSTIGGPRRLGAGHLAFLKRWVLGKASLEQTFKLFLIPRVSGEQARALRTCSGEEGTCSHLRSGEIS